jgi:hypothetical protein
MNERIKQLAEQAQQYAEYVTPQGCEWLDTFKEKFAKLIVEECAQELSRVPGGYDSSVFYKNSKILKEHFGVEE